MVAINWYLAGDDQNCRFKDHSYQLLVTSSYIYITSLVHHSRPNFLRSRSTQTPTVPIDVFEAFKIGIDLQKPKISFKVEGFFPETVWVSE